MPVHAWVEQYKAEHKKTTQKSKGVPKTVGTLDLPKLTLIWLSIWLTIWIQLGHSIRLGSKNGSPN